MLTRKLGEIVSSAVRSGTSESAREAAKPGIIDTVATMLAGRREAPVTILLRACGALPAGAAKEVAGLSATRAAEAALINGVAAHVLDFDDVALRGHPSAVMVPAILALAAELGSSGREALDAYVVGYQVWGELVQREPGMHHIKGWHPTSVFGSVGAAAACAALLRLDAGRAAHAIGLGATQSAGLMANFGSMSKSFQAGRAAQAGVWAARLAQEGFTAGADVIEHPQGFLNAFSPAGKADTERPLADPAQGWTIAQQPVSIKKYPTCFYTHRTLDSILAARALTDIPADQVRDVQVHMSREHATVLRNHRPETGLAAKFSIEFAAASALLFGRAGLSELTDSVAQDARVQALMSRVSTVLSTDYSAEWQGAAVADWAVIHLADGRRIKTAPVTHAQGHAMRPLEKPDLDAKFGDCVRAGGAGVDQTGRRDLPGRG
ncbi:MAG: MmgE/PrpD family protein, partial [Pollutimonas bauzanensis]